MESQPSNFLHFCRSHKGGADYKAPIRTHGSHLKTTWEDFLPTARPCAHGQAQEAWPKCLKREGPRGDACSHIFLTRGNIFNW